MNLHGGPTGSTRGEGWSQVVQALRLWRHLYRCVFHLAAGCRDSTRAAPRDVPARPDPRPLPRSRGSSRLLAPSATLRPRSPHAAQLIAAMPGSSSSRFCWPAPPRSVSPRPLRLRVVTGGRSRVLGAPRGARVSLAGRAASGQRQRTKSFERDQVSRLVETIMHPRYFELVDLEGRDLQLGAENRSALVVVDGATVGVEAG